MAGIQKEWLEAYFSYGIDIQNRRIFLLDDIEEVSIQYIIQGLYLLSSIDKHLPIELFIGSLGGDEYEMFALYDIMTIIDCPIHTVALGKCMSAAPLLVAAGQTRYATPNTTFMVHQSSDEELSGKVSELDKVVKHYKQQASIWYALMAENTGQTEAFWRRKCQELNWRSFPKRTRTQ